MGGKYAILVAKHTSGFSLWPTAAHDYSVKNTPWKNGKGDIVAEFIASCNKYGVLPGIYCSYAGNAYFNVDGGRVLNGKEEDRIAYNKMYTTMVTELWGDKKYGNGKLLTIWFDGGIPEPDKGGPDLRPLFKKFINPVTNVFNGPDYSNSLVRWVGNEEGTAPYPFWMGSNTNMLMGIVVDTLGVIPAEDVSRMKAFGEEINKFNSPLGKGSGSEQVVIDVKKPVTINSILIQEDIKQGQRVKAYVVEGLVDGKWLKLCDGVTIVHKRIQKFSPVETTKVRLRITDQVAKPVIKKFAVYHLDLDSRV